MKFGLLKINPFYLNNIYLLSSTQYISNLYRHIQIHNIISYHNDRSAGLEAASNSCYASDKAATPGRVLPEMM